MNVSVWSATKGFSKTGGKTGAAAHRGCARGRAHDTACSGKRKRRVPGARTTGSAGSGHGAPEVCIFFLTSVILTDKVTVGACDRGVENGSRQGD